MRLMPRPGGGIADHVNRLQRRCVRLTENFEQKRLSGMERSGRPRVNLKKQILTDMSAREKHAEDIVAQKINVNTPWIMSFEAACLLLEIERGADPKNIQSRAIFQKINQYAKKNGPHGKWLRPRNFLEDFIQTHAPSWDWREDALQGEIEDRNYARENERVAKEIAEDERWGMARATKYYTADAPDPIELSGLAWETHHKKPSPEEFKRLGWSAWKHWTVARDSWPTLRELKLATAIPERELKKIVRDLRPKKGEIIKESLRHKFSRRGAVPMRYGPRLVIGVLDQFVNRLPEFSISDQERKQLRKTALLVKRAFVARWNASRRTT